MKSFVWFGLISIASANVCTNPDSTRDQYIEGLCCSRECAGAACSADTDCVSGSCLEKCCSSLDANCATCGDEGDCASCKTNFSLLDSVHPDAGTFIHRVTAAGDHTTLSSDGNVMATGSPNADSDGLSNNGLVQVYVWNQNSWEPRGSPLVGATEEEFQGFELDLNEDGTVIALGNDKFDHDGTADVGRVKVYDWNGAAWLPRADIIGDKLRGKLGISVSLSSDGKYIAVGEIMDYSNDELKGRVMVYRWSGSSWQQVGQTINGHTSQHFFGSVVSLSGDATTLAIMSRMLDSDFSPGDQGYIDGVYVYSLVNNYWGDLKKVENLMSTSSMQLSTDGLTVIVGSDYRYIDGYVFIGNAQIYDVKSSGLEQRGADLDDYLPQTQNNFIGSSVAINSDGSTVVVGARGANSNAGSLAVFDWTGTTWRSRHIFTGAAANNQMGKSASMSQDGLKIAFQSQSNEIVVKDWVSECGASASCCL
jgi:hypothetical protein